MEKRNKIISVLFLLLIFSCQTNNEINCYDDRNEILKYGFYENENNYYQNLCSNNTDLLLDKINDGQRYKLCNLFISNKPSIGIESIVYNEIILASFGFGYSVYFDVAYEYSDSMSINSHLNLHNNDLDFNNLFYTYKYYFMSELFLERILEENKKYLLFKDKVIIDNWTSYKNK